MSKTSSLGNLGIAAGGERVTPVQPPGTEEYLHRLADTGPGRLPDARPESEGTPPAVPGPIPRSINGNAAPDLRSHCPVCGNAYQPGEGILALACLSFGAGAVPPSPAAPGRDSVGKVLLGHHGCVLPRLLTLVVGFQPEVRFVTASREVSAAESLFPERDHDEP